MNEDSHQELIEAIFLCHKFKSLREYFGNTQTYRSGWKW